MAALGLSRGWGYRALLLAAGPVWGGGTRRGVRALRRRPVRVLSPGQGPAGTVAKPEPEQRRRESPGSGRELKPEPERRKRESPGSGRELKPEPRASSGAWEELGLHYERALPGDGRLSKVMTIVKSRTFREKKGKILLEGRRLIADALRAGAVPQTVFFSRLEYVKELPVDKLKGVKLIKVKFDEIKEWSDLVTPQGIMGIFAKPDQAKMKFPETQLQHSLPLLLICDNLRDPGNLGTILRSAAGAGCCKVLLTKGCVDAWEPKVLRAGMGAHFQVPIISNLEWKHVPDHLPSDARVHVADNCGLHARARRSGGASGQGGACDRRFQKHPKYKEEEPREAVGNWLPDLEVQSYDTAWTEAPAAIVIGGETHGVSVESLQLAESTGGKRLLIPVVPGVDSLNSAMAASILLFEGRRQLGGGGPQAGLMGGSEGPPTARDLGALQEEFSRLRS
ncbi:rRNA methyltransferase 3, mitochondrial isoform X3 [Antechinus flavipes]|uniref:rRNA methyltransferase 3, mitochondrial isoform X3 n=1 Tax=Antechinus flavipes TaxID=38775 RepID=UPI002235D065|nr:rRNA methyltransferase 3, mitochondrial isoform X3 [Antechinus flavipes]